MTTLSAPPRAKSDPLDEPIPYWPTRPILVRPRPEGADR